MDRSGVLPGGYIDHDGQIHRDVGLKPLSGREEELLAQMSGAQSAGQVTAVLSRCVEHIGTETPVSEQIARDLLVGDRQYLLLKLRALTFGDDVVATVNCPWPDCGRPLDLEFRLSDIPVRDTQVISLLHEVVLSPEASGEDVSATNATRIRFRLPNGGDQEALSPLMGENEAEALSLLLRRCIHSIDDDEQRTPELINGLSPLARMEIEKAMQARAPGLELEMGTDCPECGRQFVAPFDMQEFFFGELRTSRDLLYREVHYLAYHYHWSEAEILGMRREKRRHYIEVLADEIERLNDAVG